MALNATPSIACIGIIGKHDNPLHISLFPPHLDASLQMSFLLNSSLDIFDLRNNRMSMPSNNTTSLAANPKLDPDLGLLQAHSDRLASYGYQTNTAIKFVIIIDMSGRAPGTAPSTGTTTPTAKPSPLGLRPGDLRPAFRAIHNAYVGLLMNPFYTPDERTPLQQASHGGQGEEIRSRKFIGEIERIGRVWAPGLTNI